MAELNFIRMILEKSFLLSSNLRTVVLLNHFFETVKTIYWDS